MVYENEGKVWYYYRQKIHIMRVEVQFHKGGWWKKAETTEAIKTFKSEIGAEVSLRKFLEKMKSYKIA